MKTAFSLVLPTAGYPELLAAVAEAGFDGVEPTFHPNGIPSPDRFRDEAAALRKETDRLGLAIPSLRGGPLFWPLFGSANPEDRRRAVELARQALEALRIMGGDVLLVVPGRWDKGRSYFHLWDYCMDTARMLADVAAEMKLIVGLENVENRFLCSPREWCEFVDTVGNPHLRVYFDPGNVVYLDMGHPGAWIRDLGSRICRVHMKDSRNVAEGVRKSQEVVPLLAGNVEWHDIVQALKDIGYDSWLSAELPLPETGRREFLKETAEQMRRIWSGTI